LQHAAVRFNSGGSGSFVSADGLVITNHHVGADALQKLSSAGHDYLKDGFHARARSEEIKCVDLELNVLESIEDVTSKIEAVVKPGMDTAAAQQARRAVMNTLEEESRTATGLRSDVITLYQGGQYNLYRYKKYTDIRLVFAPEQDIAFFGGDPDNFEYPRYDLDICFFRLEQARGGRQRAGVRGRQPRSHRSLEYRRTPGIPPRPDISVVAEPAAAARSAAADV
jgi:hypothetical protein